MRILIVNNFAYVTGGADRHCFDLARLLREAGHTVMFLATASPQNVESEGAFVPLEITNATRDEAGFRQRARVASRAFWHRGAARAMEDLVEAFNPDVVHAHKIYPHLSVAPIIVARRRDLPLVQTLHDYEFISASAVDHTGSRIDRKEARAEYRALNTALFALKRRWHVPAVSEWIAVSRAVATTYANHGIKAHTIPNATLTAGGRTPGFDERDGILYAGRLTVAKGVWDVVQVARALPDANVSVAGGGPLADEVATAAAELANLDYLGSLSQEEVQVKLRESRVCLTPSRWQEPGALGALEAMAAGTPLVVSPVGGLAEYVGDAEAGIVTDGSAGALARACAQLLESRELWERLSRHAVAAIERTHSPTSFLNRTAEMYTAAIEGRAAHRRRNPA